MASLTTKKVIIKNDHELILRAPKISDAEQLVTFNKQAEIDSKYLLRGPGEFTLTVEQEAEWIQKILDSDNAVVIIGEIDGEIVGMADAHGGRRKRISHIAELGTSVSSKWRGFGVGRAIMSELCSWAKENQKVEFLELSVMGDNTIAKNLYDSLGFQFISEQPKAYKYEDGSYQSNITMRLEV